MMIPTMLVMLTLPHAHAAPYWWDDAGSGHDANGPEDPLALPGLGTYAAYLAPTLSGRTPVFERDWFMAEAPSAEPVCTSARVESDAVADVTFELSGADATRRVHARATDDRSPLTLAFAAPSSSGLLLGLDNPAVGWDNVGNYTFALSQKRLSEVSGDAGNGDASGLLQMARGVTNSCIGGSLSPLGSGDARDAYRLDAAQPGGTAVISFTHAPGGVATLDVLDAGGERIARLADGGVAAIAIPTGGLYLAASTTSVQDVVYLIGSIVRPPGSEPCRPHCIDATS